MYSIEGLNHFNIAAADLEASAKFYEALGLRRGHRPDFGSFNHGIWMYCGVHPILHLNDAKEVGPITPGTGAVHHVGLSVSGEVDDVTRHLDHLGIHYDLWAPIEGVCRALYFHGPDGEHIEMVMVDCFVPCHTGA